MITVEVRPFFILKQLVGRPSVEMRIREGTTVQEMLVRFAEAQGQKVKKAMINPENNEIDSHYLILINDQPVSQLPMSMATVLQDKDVITILTFAFGG
jgi:hypothetical protein